MPNVEKEIAEEILGAGGQSVSKLGLRFDRVVVAVLGDLRAYAEAAAPTGATLIVTLSAPIRSPAKTVSDLEQDMAALFHREAPAGDRCTLINGNAVCMRLVQASSPQAQRLLGFVHNADSQPALLMDLAERWLRTKT